MRKKKAIVFLCLAIILFNCYSLIALDRFVLKNVKVIPMTEEIILDGQSVYVENGIIQDIGAFDTLTYPVGTYIYDTGNKYLIPGLSDMHVHVETLEELTLFLANGVTLIRNMSGRGIHVYCKEAINNGEITGPELYTTSAILDGDPPVWESNTVVADEAEVPALISSIKDETYDAVKVYERLSIPVYNAIIREAAIQGLPVVGHVPTAVGLGAVLGSGQRSIEHMSGYLNVANDYYMTLTIENKVWNCPTLIVIYNYHILDSLKTQTSDELKYIHPNKVAYWQTVSRRPMPIAEYKRVFNLLIDKNAPLVSGTDMGEPYIIPGFSLHTELEYMQYLGMSPYKVLESSTKNAALMIGAEDRLGTIEVGKEANLVLLDANPLEDIANTGTISGVCRKGELLSRADLDAMLLEVEQKYQAQ